MGIEVSTYISGLTPSWPPSGDPKNQGDDHLRLIKSVLQATFPNATKPFYLPSATALSGPSVLNLTAAHAGTVVYCSTTGGVPTVNLPALALGDAGWSATVIKYTLDANIIYIGPASGSIYTQFGAVVSMRLGSVCSAVRLIWTGAVWVATRDGQMIGSTVNWDGSAVPYGWLALDGSVFDAGTYTELYLALGSVTTLRDKRGRVDIGAGAGSLTARVAGTTYGNETKTLATANLPPYTPSGTNAASSLTGASATVPYAYQNTVALNNVSGNQIWGTSAGLGNTSTAVTGSAAAQAFTGSAQGGVSTPIDLLQPSIGSNKIIRAC